MEEKGELKVRLNLYPSLGLDAIEYARMHGGRHDVRNSLEHLEAIDPL